MDVINFIHNLSYQDLTQQVIDKAKLCLIDLIGVAAAGSSSRLLYIASEFAREQMPGDNPVLFSSKEKSKVSMMGSAYLHGAMIDSYDAHDGHVLCKGHVGVSVFATLMAIYGNQLSILIEKEQRINNHQLEELITSLVIGYELGTRLGISMHQQCSEYHTSGAWNCIASAAIISRKFKLNSLQTFHALSIAEFYGPRSPMMQCIDNPSMLKDGSSVGSMIGLFSALQAAKGFSGSNVSTIYTKTGNTKDIFKDLTTNWYILEQYHKLYPVCRWAQPAIEAAFVLKKKINELTSNIDISNIFKIEIYTFEAACRLFSSLPKNTEQAQYAITYPFVLALLTNDISKQDILNINSSDEILKLIRCTQLISEDKYNKLFPAQRWARVKIFYKYKNQKDEFIIDSGDCRTIGDSDLPYSQQTIIDKSIQLIAGTINQRKAKLLVDFLCAEK